LSRRPAQLVRVCRWSLGNYPHGSRWRSPVAAHRFDTTIAVRAEEARAIQELGVRNLRRLQHHDPSAPGWRVIGRLLRPLEAVSAGLDSPPTPLAIEFPDTPDTRTSGIFDQEAHMQARRHDDPCANEKISADKAR